MLIIAIADLRRKAVQTTVAVVSGGYQTALVSYFINRDFFPALMKVCVPHYERLEGF